MASFKALNIESDDESDIEVDDTKEIQIEEALKLYQNALKFHSEGPNSFDQAAEAYRLLFESDIFKYPESQAELRYLELYGVSSETDDTWDDVLPGSVVPTGSLESGPSTLPQVLHLAHKNYAQFRLEALIAKFELFNVTFNQILADATAALDHFVHALDKDDTDLDLWRRTACVGEILDSKRVARCCLESVLEGDDEGLSGVLALPGLEESLAGDVLRNLIGELQDDLTVLQRPLSASKRRTLSKILRQRLRPYDDLTRRAKLSRDEDRCSQPPTPPKPLTLKAPQTWAELGETLVVQLNSEQHGTASTRPGCAIAFGVGSPLQDSTMLVDSTPQESPLEPGSTTETAAGFPTKLEDQFPGLDEGQPTVQPKIAAANEGAKSITQITPENDSSVVEAPVITLPSRKRSGESAGLVDGHEEGRTKSRRIRARDSNVDSGDSRQAIIDANTRWEYEQQLNEFQAADDWMFETVGGLFEKIGIVSIDAARHVRQDLQAAAGTDRSTPSGDPSSSMQVLRHARSDLQAFLDKFNDQMAQIILHGEGKMDLNPDSNDVSIIGMFTSGGTSRNVIKLPAMPNEGVEPLLRKITQDWLTTAEANWEFIKALLQPVPNSSEGSKYTKYLWAEDLKTMVVRNLVNFDSTLYEKASTGVYRWQQAKKVKASTDHEKALVEMIQTIFELHLDIYCLIKQKNSGVDDDTITAQGDRLTRWSNLARESMQRRALVQSASDPSDHLNLRFLWATTFYINAIDDTSQEHLIECMNDLRKAFVSAGGPTIQLQNNAIMPELSVPALDQEMSKLTTREFFSRVTDEEHNDPASLIENLEPLLELLDPDREPSKDGNVDEDGTSSASEVSKELLLFLKNSDVSVKLMLWKRLRDAYNAIDYRPMVVYSYFRTIRIVLDDIKSSAFVELPRTERQITLLKNIRSLRLLVKKLFALFQENQDVMECIDEFGLRAAVQSLGDILQLIQVFNVAEDSIRVGQAQPPTLSNGLPSASFASINNAMHEMQIHVWTIMYTLLREAISQNAELFPTPIEDRFDFLRTVHRNLGLRKICGSCNRSFVRLLKGEFFAMTHVDGYDSEQAQVLYDLHGLNCFLNPSYELMEHECTRDAFVDRAVAMASVDLLLAQASKLPIRDLVKHSLKDTIDRVHGALARKRPTEAILRNRDVYRAFLKSPINRLDLFNCVKGEGNYLLLSPIPKEDALLASKGWYFLMGHMALVKFRSQKRTAPTPTEDLDIAIAFFMQSLEYTGEHWETWFRLAQAYDTKIEENVVWSAEKLNQNMNEIVQLQRSAIHCFTMATALAHRSADLAFETSSKITELYTDFANRLYSSSREPFAMLAFAIDDMDRFISTDQGIEKGKTFQALSVYTAWKLALAFFKRALVGKPEQWTLHYMIGKCLAKMHHADEQIRRRDTPITGEKVVGAFVRALELLPDKDKKEGRDSKREPVLEPHYKLVSVIHKLVVAGSIDLRQAEQALQHTQYAIREPFPERIEDWTPYVLSTLKHLRTADKSNWYHRMIARAAHLVYKDTEDPALTDQTIAATNAKQELTQQMFTKTMVLQVWKPETERAGRHFVYTSRYTRFFVSILKQLKDRTNLEALARRVRRRPHDLFEHGLVWQETCSAYLQLLRSHAQLSEGLETSTFSNIAHDDFLLRREPLEKWMQSQPQGASPALDVLRDVQELKKINQGLMKPGVIDDLIGDSYAHLFNTIGKQLFEEERKLKQDEEARRPPPAASPPRNPMMSLTHLMNSEGNADVASGPRVVIPMIPSPSNQPDQAPVRRKIGVGRREIRTCAESCYPKGGLQNGNSAKSLGPVSSRLQAVVDSHTAERGRLAGDVSADNSAPASIHDSADESELSELDDEADDGDDEGSVHAEATATIARRPVFPGLTSIIRGEAVDVSDGGFETGEEEAQDEGEDADMQDGPDAEKADEQAIEGPVG